jgi:glycosyltransferase involved in cell wall biosynthesis
MPIKVSLLIPTWNRAPSLERALSSALEQTYESLEIIVLDNGSTDDTPELSRRYAGTPRLTWQRNPQNIGLASNWEKLLYELATGDYDKFLADDDYLTNPENIAESVALVEKYDVRAVFSGGRAFGVHTGESFDMNLNLPPLVSPQWWMDHFAEKRRGKCICPTLPTGALFHRKTSMEFGAFRNPVFGMDIELTLQFMLSGPTGYMQGDHYVLVDHLASDGRVASLAVVLSSLDLFERIRRFGQNPELKLSQDRLAGLCRRGHRFMIRDFIVRAWLGRYGVSLHSWWTLFHFLWGKTGFSMAFLSALDPVPLVKYVLKPTSSFYRRVRWVYRLFLR